VIEGVCPMYPDLVVRIVCAHNIAEFLSNPHFIVRVINTMAPRSGSIALVSK
jgi:hypothetical protein